MSEIQLIARRPPRKQTIEWPRLNHLYLHFVDTFDALRASSPDLRRLKDGRLCIRNDRPIDMIDVMPEEIEYVSHVRNRCMLSLTAN